MEFFACIIGGIALIACGGGLFLVRAPHWPQDETHTDAVRNSIKRWSKFQRGVRFLNNTVLIAAGGAIVSAAFVPHGRTWMLLWSSVLLLLLLSILLAMIDALTSLSGYRKSIPRVAEHSLSNERDL